MSLRTARILRIVAGLVAAVAGVTFVAGLVVGFPPANNLGSSVATTAAAAVLLWATHIEAKLNQDGNQ